MVEYMFSVTVNGDAVKAANRSEYKSSWSPGACTY